MGGAFFINDGGREIGRDAHRHERSGRTGCYQRRGTYKSEKREIGRGFADLRWKIKKSGTIKTV
jgi:hypothetical protein